MREDDRRNRKKDRRGTTYDVRRWAARRTRTLSSLSFPTFLIGNPGFCSRRTRTHGGAEKNLDPRVREDDRRNRKKDRRGTTYDVRRWAARRTRTLSSLSFPTFSIGNPGFCSRRTRTHGGAEKNLDPRVREDDRRNRKKDRRGTTYDVRRWAAGRTRTLSSLSFPTFLIGNPGFCSRRTRTHGGAEKTLDPRVREDDAELAEAQEEEKPWIPACARMTRNWPRRKKKKNPGSPRARG